MNLFTKQKQTHRLREQTYGYQGGNGGGKGQGIKKYKRLCIKEISYKDILYRQRIQPIFYNNFKQSIIYKILNHYVVHLKTNIIL